MKKVIVLFLCLTGMTLMAQKGEKKQRNSKDDMTAEQTATLKTKRMTLALDLNDAQQKEIQSLNLENAKIQQTLKDQRKTRKDSNEVKKPTSDERYAMMNQQLDYKIAQKSKMKNILSSEQFEKWETMTQKEGKHRREKDGSKKNQTHE